MPCVNKFIRERVARQDNKPPLPPTTLPLAPGRWRNPRPNPAKHLPLKKEES